MAARQATEALRQNPGDAKRRALPLTAEVEKEIEEFKTAGPRHSRKVDWTTRSDTTRSAADLDEGYVWTNAHTLHSNMSAVYARSTEKWEDSRQEAVISNLPQPQLCQGRASRAALKDLGKLPEAVQCFQRALSLEPSNEATSEP